MLANQLEMALCATHAQHLNSGKFAGHYWALPMLCVPSCSDTGRASGTQRLDSDRASICAKILGSGRVGFSDVLRIETLGEANCRTATFGPALRMA